MAIRLFIDGAAGTTGLEIRERLAGRSEFALIVLDDAQRNELLALFPELQSGHRRFGAARRSLRAHEARVLLSA